VVRRVARLLEVTYGSPRHGNPIDPMDDLVFIVLSNRTGANVAARVYAAVKSRFADWDELLAANHRELTMLIGPAGLAGKRASQLIGIARRLHADFGTVSLEALRGRDDDDALDYLASLPGVSRKVASCVLLYTMSRQLLPVDVHVHRLTHRLGWHRHKRGDQSHETLEALVPPELRYGLHVNAIAHGRAVCRSVAPTCESCPIRNYCEYYLSSGK
jgi:endonuclease III